MGKGEARARGGVLRRAIRNAGLLLTGKGAAGVMQLATFAVLARTLGLSDFGFLAILLAQIQLLMAFATFQSNQAIVRYGVKHLHDRESAGFQSLVIAGSSLDLLAAALATIAALFLAALVGAAEDWPGHVVAAAYWLALLPLANAIATPKGILRLYGRFDLLARHVTITPAARLVGALLVTGLGGGLLGFVIAWIVAAWIGGLAAFYLGWREARRNGMLKGMQVNV